MTVINEIAFGGNAIVMGRHIIFLRAQKLGEFRFGPTIKLSFLAFAVGVLGGIKSALRVRHIPQDIVQNVPDGGGVGG